MNVTLIDATGARHELTRAAAQKSGMLKEILDNDDDANVEIPMPQIAPAALAQVVAFLLRHERMEEHPVTLPLTSDKLSNLIHDPADLALVKNANLPALRHAADYMDVGELFAFCNAAMMAPMVNKSALAVRRVTGFIRPLTTVEQSQIAMANALLKSLA